MTKTNNTLTVLVDLREKRPLLFPSLLTWHSPGRWPLKFTRRTFEVVAKPQRLDAGDYAILGYESTCLVERKAGLEELINNFLSVDRVRFDKAVLKLVAATEHPILFIERLPPAWWLTDNRPDMERALDATFALQKKYGISLIWGSQVLRSVQARRRLGEIVLRAMLPYVLEKANAHD